MARPAAILKALATAYRRDWTALQSLTGNNFFLLTLLLLQRAGVFVYLIMGLIVLFPLSTDPLRKVPPSRLALWPLTRRDHWLLRLASPWLNPVTWLLAAGAAWSAGRTVSLSLWAAVAAVCAAAFALSHLPAPGRTPMWRRVSGIPGPLDQLVRKNLREILSTLDFYCAAILSASVLAWRIFGAALPGEALMAMTVITVGALSSYAQCLFGLDGEGGLARYRLLPVRGWQLLLAKDIAFLLALLPLSLPLAPLAAIAGALMALAVGHAPAVHHPREQTRWRFSMGGALGNGIVQIIGLAMAVSTVFSMSILFLFPIAVIWAASLGWYGRELERSL
ncbi:MAG: hypothetical protein KGN36_12295 [Acidobacteriota bacterium]|nr:hypothetical protein [Acidobacteriota bacterium]